MSIDRYVHNAKNCINIATITIYEGVIVSCDGGKRSVVMMIVNEGGIAKPSICIGQRLADFPMELLANLGNDDFCSHGPSLSFSLFFSFYVPQSTFVNYPRDPWLFKRQTPSNSIQCVTGTNRVYAHTPDHNNAKCHGDLLVNIFLSGCCTWEEVKNSLSAPFIFIINRQIKILYFNTF